MSFKEFKSTVCTPKVAGPHKENKTPTTATTLTNKSDSAKDHNISALTSCTTATPSPVPSTSSSTSSSTATNVQGVGEVVHMKLGKLFKFIDDTYRELRCYNTGLRKKDSYSTQLMQTINKYKM